MAGTSKSSNWIRKDIFQTSTFGVEYQFQERKDFQNTQRLVFLWHSYSHPTFRQNSWDVDATWNAMLHQISKKTHYIYIYIYIYMGVSINRGKTLKMDGENNGKPYEQMDDLGGFCPPI